MDYNELRRKLKETECHYEEHKRITEKVKEHLDENESELKRMEHELKREKIRVKDLMSAYESVSFSELELEEEIENIKIHAKNLIEKNYEKKIDKTTHNSGQPILVWEEFEEKKIKRQQRKTHLVEFITPVIDKMDHHIATEEREKQRRIIKTLFANTKHESHTTSLQPNDPVHFDRSLISNIGNMITDDQKNQKKNHEV